MATERIQFSLPGLLAVDQVSQQSRATYARTLKYVRLSTLGINPSGADITVRLRIGGSAQATTYSLPAGLKSAENTAANVSVAANTWHDFIVVTTGDAADLIVEAEFEVAVSALGGSTTDLGLGTLGQLKRFLLSAGIVAETTYDEALTFIGKGVAGAFDRYCNRTFKRGASITEDFRGGTDLLLLARYPVESIASVGLKTVGESAFTSQGDVIDTAALETGCLLLTATTGTERDQLRVTYTGGYWYDTSDDGSGSQPSGSTLLPTDIQLTWLLECQHVWQSRDKLGIEHTQGDGTALLNTRLGILELSPFSKAALEPYRRLIL
jgi:hypothetical protein